MIYGYKIIDGNINYLGASDTQERLIKALEMANIDTTGIQFTDTEPVNINGKYFLSAGEAEAQAEQAIVDKAKAIIELNNEYNEAKALYREYYTTAIMRNDTELAQSIADDDIALDTEYDTQLVELEA